MKLQVDESGEYTLGKLSPKTGITVFFLVFKYLRNAVATATNSHKIAAAQFLMRKRIATEILTTERSYIKSLQTVMVRISLLFLPYSRNFQQLVETVKTSKSLNEREFYTVFANLPEVC